VRPFDKKVMEFMKKFWAPPTEKQKEEIKRKAEERRRRK